MEENRFFVYHVDLSRLLRRRLPFSGRRHLLFINGDFHLHCQRRVNIR